MWYEKQDENNEVILASQVNISRNIKGFSFPVKMTKDDKENVIGMARQVASELGLGFIRTDELDDTAKADLFNNYYADIHFMQPEGKTAILLGKEEGLCVQINGKDHINVKSLSSGDDIRVTYKKAEDIAVEFEKRMPVAFSEKRGFLTSDIKNVGTGVQISALIMIPGIVKTTGAMAMLSKRLEKFEWNIKSLIQGGDVRVNSLFVISNTATLGIDENELLERAESVLRDVIKLEKSCRSSICAKKAAIAEDQYYKSYGVLRYARRLEIPEALMHINWIILATDNIKDSEVELTWSQIHLLVHNITRRYEEIATRGKRTVAIPRKRAERVRGILKGDEAK